MARKISSGATAWSISAALAVTLTGLVFFTVRHLQETAFKRSQTLTVAAQTALERSDFEGAARYALAAMQGKDAPVTGFDAHKAEIVLAGAVAYSPALPGRLYFNDSVESVAYSSDGKLLAVTLNSGGIQLWAPSTHKRLATMPSEPAYGEQPVFSTDSHELQLAGQAWTLTPVADGTIQMAAIPVTALPSPAARIVKALDDAAARSNYTFPDTYLATSPDGNTVLSAKGHHLHVWNARTGQMTDIAPSPLVEIDSDFDEAIYAPSGRLIALRASDTVVIMDTGTMQLNRAVLRSDTPIELSRFSPDGESLAIVSDHDTLRVYDTRRLDPKSQIMHQIGIVSDAAFAPDGQTIAVAGGDQQVRFWDLRTGQPTRKIQLPQFEARSDVIPLDAWIARDGKTVAVKAYNKNNGAHISLWDITLGRMIGLPLADSPNSHILGISDDNAVYVSTNDHNRLSLIDSTTHAILRQGIPTPPESCGPLIAMSFDHRYLACHRIDNVALFDLKGAGQWQILSIPTEGVAFTSDSKSLRVYDLDDGHLATFVELPTLKKVKRPEPAHEQANAPLIFDGAVAVAADYDGLVYIDMKSGQRMGPDPLITWARNNVGATSTQVHVVDTNHMLTTYGVDPAIGLRGKALMERACSKVLPGNLSKFRDEEWQQTPLLDPKRDRDVCGR